MKAEGKLTEGGVYTAETRFKSGACHVRIPGTGAWRFEHVAHARPGASHSSRRIPSGRSGIGVMRKYGRISANPFSKRSFASTDATASSMKVSSPAAQFAGVPTCKRQRGKRACGVRGSSSRRVRGAAWRAARAHLVVAADLKRLQAADGLEEVAPRGGRVQLLQPDRLHIVHDNERGEGPLEDSCLSGGGLGGNHAELRVRCEHDDAGVSEGGARAMQPRRDRLCDAPCGEFRHPRLR